MSEPVENSLSFDELRTSLDALCDHYLDDGVSAKRTTTVDATASSAPSCDECPSMTDENRNFLFGRLLQKIINFYSRNLFRRSVVTPNADVATTTSSTSDDVMVDDAHGQAKFVSDDMIEYAFTSEDADVLLLLKANERPHDENTDNYEMPVQQITIK
jgi:hypothetical protein